MERDTKILGNSKRQPNRHDFAYCLIRGISFKIEAFEMVRYKVSLL